jgi:membrane protein YdbS with pleckstrin-like domain
MERMIKEARNIQIIFKVFLRIKNSVVMNFSKILKKNEELISLNRRHFLVYVKETLISLIIFLSPFFFMFLLFKWGSWGMIVFLLLIISGLLALLKLWVVYHYNVFLITNQRIILYLQNGLFERNVSEIEFGKIQDISYRYKGFWQTFLKYGSLKIQVINSETVILVSTIPHPEKIQQLLLSVQKNYSHNQSNVL